MGYSKGICWIGDCRIPFVDEEGIDFNVLLKQTKKDDSDWVNTGFNKKYIKKQHKPEGRFTPNLLVSDDVLNDGYISKSGGRKIYKDEDTNIKNNVYNDGWVRTGSDIKDKGSSSRYYNIDIWFNTMIDGL
jgi:hypothetical protein